MDKLTLFIDFRNKLKENSAIENSPIENSAIKLKIENMAINKLKNENPTIELK